MDYREHGELSCSPSHVLRVHMHNAFYTGWMYSLHPFILPSCAPRRRLGQCCKCRRLHRVLWGESLLESLTPARSPWASLTAAIHRTVLSAQPLLAACWAFQPPFLWPVSSVWQQPGRAVGMKLCAQHPLLCLPWALLWHLGGAPSASLIWTTCPSPHHDS